MTICKAILKNGLQCKNFKLKYGFPNGKPEVCHLHKDEGMISFYNMECITPNCKTNPVFNFPSELYGIYCNMHKMEGMINVIAKKMYRRKLYETL